jgi:hypothetical protein
MLAIAVKRVDFAPHPAPHLRAGGFGGESALGVRSRRSDPALPQQAGVGSAGAEEMDLVVEKNYRDKRQKREQLKDRKSKVKKLIKTEETKNRNTGKPRSRQGPKTKTQNEEQKWKHGE